MDRRHGPHRRQGPRPPRACRRPRRPQARTLAFGDYLNDYELLEAAGTAWAMDNAHPDIRAIADHIAPPNTEAGVVTVLRELLDP
ncbi:HAD hydrolase family protein [Corynebacterium suedekumii]|nr:HAD hydrolase family protein [Corynebacterium suedekumii]